MMIPWIDAWVIDRSAMKGKSSRTLHHHHHHRHQAMKTTVGSPHRTFTMDMEGPISLSTATPFHRRLDKYFQSPSVNPKRIVSPRQEDDKSASYHDDMPWESSIDPEYPKAPFYMPFWNWQIKFMKDHLTNLVALPVVDRIHGHDLSYVQTSTSPTANNDTSNHITQKKNQRMITLCFASDEYRLIRMTLLDGGYHSQVFTACWYPRDRMMPILGIDLLQFHKETRHLTVLDFQPIQPTERDHDTPYEHLLRPIRQQYPRLQGKMTKRFYDETQFFSSQLLLGREPTPDYVWTDVYPAFQAYIQTHVGLMQSLSSSTTKASNTKYPSSVVVQRQAAYDEYSADRDPCHGLLANLFGQDYADRFVYDILFPLSSQTTRSKQSEGKE